MSDQMTCAVLDNQRNVVNRISVLEALADAAYGVGPCRSNQTTPPAADASDQ